MTKDPSRLHKSGGRAVPRAQQGRDPGHLLTGERAIRPGAFVTAGCGCAVATASYLIDLHKSAGAYPGTLWVLHLDSNHH
jgi:hypothetical protein